MSAHTDSLPPSRLTLPGWVWLALFALALVTRLSGLAAVPLGPGEASRALDALDVTRGAGWPTLVRSPLLLMGNTTLFQLFGAGDGIARLLPALAGLALVMVPWLWRKQLGEVGALVAGLLLLISPLSLFAARQVNDATLGAVSAAVIVTVILRASLVGFSAASHEPDRPGPKTCSALLGLGVMIGLTSGPAFFDLFVPGLVAWGIVTRLGQRQTASLRWQRPALAGLGGAALISIGLGLRWGGWDGIAAGAAAWLSSWLSGGVRQMALVPLYEPLLLILLVAGAILAIVRTRKKTKDAAGATLLALGIWGGTAFLLDALRSGTPSESWSLVIVPLALLAGYVVETVLREASPTTMRQVGLHTALSLIAWVPVLLGLAQYAYGLTYNQWEVLIVLGVVMVVALQGMMVYLFAMVIPARDAWRGGLLGLAIAALFVQGSFASGLTYVRATSPVEPAIAVAPSPDMRHLRSTIETLMLSRGLRTDTLPIAVMDQDSEITILARWTLRDFKAMQVTQAWPTDPNALVISPETAIAGRSDASGVWRGMRFVASTLYNAPIPGCTQILPPECSQAVAWYLYRTSPFPIEPQALILWQNDAAVGR